MIHQQYHIIRSYPTLECGRTPSASSLLLFIFVLAALTTLGWILFKNKDDNIREGLEQNKTLIVAFVALSILLLLIDKEVKNIGSIGLTNVELGFFGGSIIHITKISNIQHF